MRDTLRKLTSRLLYPILLGATLLIIYLAVTQRWDLKRALWGYLVGLIGLLITIERMLPLSPEWGMTRTSFLCDLKYLVASGVTIAAVRTGFGTLALWLSARHPHRGLLAGASVVTSVVVFLLVFELLQYGFHRLSHEGRGPLGRFLWRVHLAHHLPDRVYVVMHGVFHPLNALISAVLIQTPLLLLGMSPESVFAAVLIIDLQTMISHFNVDVRAGFLSYLFVGTELHRYHHSARLDEAKNFGTVIPLWDLVFGTFLNRPGTPPSRLGVDSASGYPPARDFWKVLALPFRG
ncbi:MAG: sterol desaturase family protein [Polyangia bacterium]